MQERRITDTTTIATTAAGREIKTITTNHSRASSSEALEDPFVRTFANEEPNTLREDTLQTGKNNQPLFLLFTFHPDKPNLAVHFFRYYY